MVVASNSGENGWRQREPSQGDARRPPPKGFELRRLRRKPKADVDSAFPSKKQRHSRGEMRSEHNRGASLAAFLLAVSTVTLLFVSPVEGQGEDCVVTAFPGEPGSCPALDVQGNPLLCVSGLCFTCESADIAVLGDCAIQFDGDAVQIANCQRDCFAHYECTSNADCPANEPTCIIIGQCRRECEVNALPGAAGSCPDIPAGQLFAGPEFCVQGGVTSVCIECARYEQELGITTAADCERLGVLGHTAVDIANCQRGCFGFYACATSAECPADRPLCESGQCLCGTNADCPADRPLCESGQCLAECGTNADCPADRPLCDSGQCLAECGTNADCPADRPLCESGQCLAECGTNADCPADRPLRDAGQCLAECANNADCPADRPLCDAGQCVVSSVPSSPTFSPLDGMGGGSSA